MAQLDTLPAELLALIVEHCDALSGYMCLFVNRNIADKLTSQCIAFDGNSILRNAVVVEGDALADSLRQLEWLWSVGRPKALPHRLFRGSVAPKKRRPAQLRQLVATASRDCLKQLLASGKYKRYLHANVFALAAILRDFDVLALLQAYRCPTAGSLGCARRARRQGNVRWLESRCIE